MHETEQRIAEWRQELSAAGCGPEVVDELESHLRDEMHRLILAGESETPAMDSAFAKLGSPKVLAAEFAKVAPVAAWLPIRLAYGVMMILAVATLGLVLSLQGNGVVQSATLLLRAHVVSLTLGYLTTLVAGSLAICYLPDRLFRGLTPGQSRSLSSATFRLSAGASLLTALGILLGAVWSKGQLGSYWGWDIREIGGCMVLCVTLAQTFIAWRRPSAVHAQMQIAIVGNVVVAATWFGYHALHIMSRTGMFTLATFFVIQVVAITISLAPARILHRQRA